MEFNKIVSIDSRKTLYSVICIIMIVFFVVFIFTQTVLAANHPGTGRAEYHGYFENKSFGANNCTGAVVNGGISISEKGIDPAVGTTGSGNKSGEHRAYEFILKITFWRDETFGKNAQNKTAAEYIILTMMGKKGGTPRNEAYGALYNDWVNRVLYYGKNNRINFDEPNLLSRTGWNSYYQSNWNCNPYQFSNYVYDDIAMHYGRIDPGPSIVFLDKNNNRQYEIRKDCVNPVGDLNPLDKDETSANLDMWSSVRVGGSTPPEKGVTEAYIDYKNTTDYVWFRNVVNTTNLVNVADDKAFRFGTRLINSDLNFDWTKSPETHDSVLSERYARVNNPSLYYATGKPNTLNDSYTKFKINYKAGAVATDYIGKQICREIYVSEKPKWLIGGTTSKACVTIKGDALNLNLDITDVSHEKGTGEKTVSYKLLRGGNAFCSEAIPIGATTYIEAEKKLFDGSYESLGEKEIKNCEPITADIIFGTDTLTNLDTKTIGDANNKISMRVKVKAYLAPWLRVRVNLVPERPWSDPRVENISIYEAPFVIFNGNDVRACPTADFKNRFVFNKDDSKKGSRSWLASLWGTGATLSSNSAGWSDGINTNNDNNILNNIKAKGIDCGEAVSYTGDPVGIPATDLGTNGQKTTTAKKVYINGDITSTAPSAPTSTPPKYEINAEDVYISQDVKLLQGVIINATNVYTCATRNGASGDTKIGKGVWHTECTNPLRIEGSINAQNLYLMRSVGTRYKSDGGGAQVGITASGPRSDPLAQPAEVIVYPAYFYFTNVGASGAGSTKGSIDSYSQAPPRL